MFFYCLIFFSQKNLSDLRLSADDTNKELVKKSLNQNEEHILEWKVLVYISGYAYAQLAYFVNLARESCVRS